MDDINVPLLIFFHRCILCRNQFPQHCTHKTCWTLLRFHSANREYFHSVLASLKRFFMIIL